MSKAKKIQRQKKTAGKPARVPKPKRAIPVFQEILPLKWKMLIAGALAVVAMAIYFPSHNYDFVYDDDAVVKENRFVKQGLKGLDEIWSTSYFQGYDPNINARAFRPIPLSTLAAEYEVWGLNPQVNHRFNVFFYGLTAFFLFLLLSTLLRDFHPVFPIAASLLFLLHPIHLEVVANIKSRDTMLGFLGFIIAAWLLLKHLDSRKILPLVFSLVFYFFGLFSKEEVITTVAVIPLMLYFFRTTPGKNRVTLTNKKIAFLSLPFLLAAIAYLIIRASILGGLNAGVTLTALDNTLLGAKSFGERSASTILVLGHYLLKTIFPHPLISDYSLSTIPLTNWTDWKVYLSLLGNLGLLALGILGLIKKKAFGFGPLYYFCTVSIFTSIVTPNVSAYNDRFLFSPVLGICILASWLILKLVKETSTEQETRPVQAFFKNNFVAVALMALLCSAGIYKILGHLPVWRNSYVLFEHDAKLVPGNARMRKNYGGALARQAVEHQQSDPSLSRELAAKAVEELKAALAIYNNIPTGYIHLGNMYIIRGEYELAEQALRQALEQEPTNYFARTSLGNVFYRTGRYQEAAQIVESIDPELRRPNDYNLLAMIYSKLGDEVKAGEYRKLVGGQ